jgi:hypothetical protein
MPGLSIASSGTFDTSPTAAASPSGAAGREPQGLRRNTMYTSYRRPKFPKLNWRLFKIFFSAAIRFKRVALGKLAAYERRLLYPLYISSGVMRDSLSLATVMSKLGIGSGIEEMQRYVEEIERYKPGKVVSFFLFCRLASYLKLSFILEKRFPDSHVAFIALGGEAGSVNAERLKQAITDFKLTIDIDKFIAENDADGSGMLEIEEFSALFEDNNDAHEARPDDDAALLNVATGGADADEEDSEGRPKAAIGGVSILDPAGVRNPAAAAAPDSADQREKAPAAAAKVTQKLTVDEVAAEAAAIVDAAAKEAAAITPHATPAQLKASGSPTGSARRHPLYAPRAEPTVSAHENLERRTGHVPRGSSFGTAPRFDAGEPVVALPPPPASHDGTKSAVKLPAVNPRRDPNQSPRWFEQNPFDAPRSPRSARQPGASERQKLPIVARNEKGQSVIVQPDMSF